jgi:membrane-bound acyltransferase YfiQ involved in biofilm formation
MHNQTNVLSSSPDAAVSKPALPVEPPPATVQPLQAARAKAVRLANVERLRVLAMLEIVRYHDHNDRLFLVGGLGLPTFLLLTNLFNCTLTHKRGPEQFMQDKRERLVVPWIFWSLFYGAFLAISAYRHQEPLSETFSWNMILAGTSSHLWFVPFAFASAGAVALAQHLTRNLPDRATGNVGIALGAVVLIGLGLLPEREYIAPLPQWILSTPSTFLGFALGRLVLADGPQFRVKTALPIAIGALLICGYCALFFPNFLMQRYATSILLVLAVLLVHGKPEPVSVFLSPLLFGIYLAHHFIADRVLSHVPGVAGMPWLFLVDFVCTVFVVRALKETPLKRFI